MTVHRKTYRFRMEPNRHQAEGLRQMAGARRWVWNWALQRKKDYYAEYSKTLTVNALCKELTELKRQPATAWLKECDSQALQQVLRDLEGAFSAFFARRAKYPRFKSKKTDRVRFRIPQRVAVSDGRVYVPKVGWIKIRQSQPVTEKTKSATFSWDGRHWFVTLVVEFELPDVQTTYSPERVVGIDLGLIDFATFSDGRPSVPAPKFFRKGQVKLRLVQRVLSRRKPGSNRREKAKQKVRRIHQKIAGQRKDFLHKLTTNLTLAYDRVCIEDLSLKGLAKTKLAKSFTDAALGEFRRQLTYKGEWVCKPVVVIDRFFPSSRLCNACGKVNDKLTLADRKWTCECGAEHVRDSLAAQNIRTEGLRLLSTEISVGHTEKRSGSRCKTYASGQTALN
jgi:putative transposase